MQNHTELLNYIAAKIGAKRYLEIGTQSCKNFNEIQVEHKVGVDPDLNSPCSVHKTSDEFFNDNQETFDLIFIDGLHHDEQLDRDICNSFKFLSIGGVMLIHDTNPSEEKYTHVPRASKVWNGDVYKTISRLLTDKLTIDIDHGCTIIRVTEETLLIFDKFVPTWENFNENRKQLLNLVSIDEGLKIIDEWI